MQRALIQYRNPKNYDLVVEALTKAGRTDLIGYDKHCLVRPNYHAGHGRAGAGDGKKKGYSSAGNYSTGKSPKGNGRAEGKKPGKKKTIRNVHKKK